MNHCTIEKQKKKKKKELLTRFHNNCEVILEPQSCFVKSHTLWFESNSLKRVQDVGCSVPTGITEYQIPL